eukprot:gene6627-6854_t
MTRLLLISITSSAAGVGGGVTRSRVEINGVASSLRVLRALSALLLDMNGQHASQALRDSQQQLQLLDKIAGVSGGGGEAERLEDVEALADDAERAALQKRVEIINKAALKPGEEEVLRRRLAALEYRRSCLEAAAAVQTGIRGDSSGSLTFSTGGGLSEGLRVVIKDEAAGRADGGLSSCVAEGVEALQAALEELELVEEGLRAAAAQVSLYADVSSYSPSEAADLAGRLDLIEKLCKRFRVRGAGGTRELLQLAQGWSQQLEAFYDSLAAAVGPPVLVLDELDAGVGSRLGERPPGYYFSFGTA